jgi:hypothetical protein
MQYLRQQVSSILLSLNATMFPTREWGIAVRTEGIIQSDATRDASILEPDPRVNIVFAESAFLNDDLSSSTSPVRVSTVSRVAIKAHVETFAVRRFVGQIMRPSCAPARTCQQIALRYSSQCVLNAVTVTREDRP